MKELLSNQEIDTLLEMFRSDDPPLASAIRDVSDEHNEAVISPVDLLRPNLLSAEQMRSLELVFQGSANLLAAVMSDKLRFEMECDCVAVEQIRFQSWLGMLGTSNCIYVMRAPGVPSPVLCSWTTELLYGAVDRILGGLGKVNKVPKELSAAEYTVADAFVAPCIERLASSTKEVLPTGWELGNRSTNPSFAQVLPLQDVVLSVHFQVGGDFLLGDMRMVLPYTVLEPGLTALAASRAQAKEDITGAREMLGKNLLPVEVDLTVQLGETLLPLRQLLELKIGDVVPLQTRLGDELKAPVQGVPKFKGQVGSLGGRRAYRISTVLES